jgi:CubicO group peptidase (beta-lactamase class C family)
MGFSHTEWSGAERDVRGALQRMRDAGAIVGAQYLAVTAAETLVDVQVGAADAAASRPMERATWQMAYSITKAITAIATLRLVDSGVVSLDRPLSHYFSGHPYGDGVLVRQLLANTAGVPSPAPLSWFTVEGEPLDRKGRLRDQLRAHPRLTAAPGARYLYTNLGYWLLEEVIQSASGMDFAEYVQRQIFGPVGTAHQIGFAPPDKEQMAIGHAARFRPLGILLRAMTNARYWAQPAGRWRRAARVVPFGRSYGGLFCPAAALAPVLADLLRPRPELLSPSSRDAMFEPQHIADGRPTGSALGWVCGALGQARYFGKQGGGLGFHGNVRVYPDLGLATVLLANTTEVSAGPIDRRSDEIDRLLVCRPR